LGPTSQEHRLQLGTQEIFHIEAMVAKVAFIDRFFSAVSVFSIDSFQIVAGHGHLQTMELGNVLVMMLSQFVDHKQMNF
jgi:hypothetical protein